MILTRTPKLSERLRSVSTSGAGPKSGGRPGSIRSDCELISSACEGKCVLMMEPIPRSSESRCSTRSTRSWFLKSRLLSGSSSTSTSGCAASARATSASWYSPPEIRLQSLSARCAMPTASSALRAISRSRGPGREKSPILALRPSSASSPTVYTKGSERACGT